MTEEKAFTRKEKIVIALVVATVLAVSLLLRTPPAEAACVSAPTRDTECGSWNKIGETFVCRSWRHFN